MAASSHRSNIYSGDARSETAESCFHVESEAKKAITRANSKWWEDIWLKTATRENLYVTRNPLSITTSIEKLTCIVTDAERDFIAAKG